MLLSLAEMVDQPEKPGGNAASGDGVDTWSDVTSSRMDLSDQRPPATASLVDKSSAVAVARVRGLRAMVVGANEEHLHVISEALHRLKVKVAVGGPDQAGYRTGLAFRPDVVVSELTRPGQPGWWLFQRFRRHPMLRWVPVLLMDWWDDTSPMGGKVPVSRVVERIADALAPNRIIEERIRAGATLADRMESTSALVLSKVFAGTRSLGTLTVNDSWNVFELGFRNGAIEFASRRGVDGEIDEGEDAFFRFLMCDTGRWSFRTGDATNRSRNIRISVEELLDNAWRLSASMVGPDAAPTDPSEVGFRVRPALFHEIASTLGGLAREVVEAAGSGVSEGEMKTLLADEDERPDVERAIAVLVRSGALMPTAPMENTQKVTRESRVVERVRQVLEWVSRDHGAAPLSDDRLSWEDDGPTRSGYYKMSRPMEEAVRLGKADGLVAPGAVRPSMIAAGVVQGRSEPSDRPTPVLSQDDMIWKDAFPDGPAARDSRQNKVLAHDSLVPGPKSMHLRMKRQMWLAISLALLLGGLLVAGLLIVGSGTREVPEEVDRR